MDKDIALLRDLAKKYSEICSDESQDKVRNIWRNHNDLQMRTPPVYVRAFAWDEMPESKLQCQDPFWQPYESFLKQQLFHHLLKDDYIFEPWITVDAVLETPVPTGNWEWGGLWGLPVKWISSDQTNGCKTWDAPLKDPDDFHKMKPTIHKIDEEATIEKLNKVQEALGDIITVNLDRGPAYRMWHADLSTELAQLRGLEQIMWDMIDRPDWLHEVLSFMRDSILNAHKAAEECGDWGLCDHQNQAMPYSNELKDPAANTYGVLRKELWYYAAAQELTMIGPQQFNEFMLQYQIPIMEQFGLTAYGCCEDLTQKIDLLRKIPNLRRIAVSPFADVAKCAEQIGTDYVISYRPNPSDMVSYDLDPERIRNILKSDFEKMKGTCFDITLKDVETVQGDPNRIIEWVRITRETIEECF